MPKTYRKKNNKKSSRKNRSSYTLNEFQKEVTIVFLEMLMMVKLFHWKTYSYATHKATDELYESLNEHIDHFIEVLLGKTGLRIDLMSNKTITLLDLNSQEVLKSKIAVFKSYLVGLDNNKALSTMSNSDLLNIRDEILGDLNKFLYLLTFK
jgi:DNA-binding ferritin-like protein